MAFPKKARLRRITFDNVVYRWRFVGGELRGTLSVYGPNSSGKVLRFHSYEWFDVWLSHPFHLRAKPEIVTPSLVRRAIEFALHHDWKPTSPREAPTFWYHDSEFRLSEPNTHSVDALRQTQFGTPELN